ncbi:MAG: hypothetical protein K2G78_05320 [Muribaculaceae bacterium]|nr:hypothetical protein [Muribaculaceae bacterium]
MKHPYSGRKILLSLSLLSTLLTASAGNIPQYGFTYGGTAYAEFTDGTLLKDMKFIGNGVLFADGTFTTNPTTGPGFPIGFDFRIGGRTVDSFVVSNYGNLYLGSGSVGYGIDAFRVGMATVKNGLYKADISYRTSGEEGSRVLTVQYKNALLNETGSDKGKYSLQIRLYEADGRIEMAFKELDTTYTGCGFDTGLSGWDTDDSLLLTAPGLGTAPKKSTFLKSNLLDPGSYIAWDEEDYDRGYSPVYTFLPESDATPPIGSPAQLEVTQEGSDILISCRRARDAAATAVLFSTEPFTDADMPVDGETFRGSYFDKNGVQVFPSALGNALPLYYGNATLVTTRIQGIEQDKTYYIRAISANGYPAWNRDGATESIFTTSQAAPSGFDGSATDNGVQLKWSSPYPVIIAATTERSPGYGAGYAGQFGTPGADAAPGDLLDGGGEVIYVGSDGLFMADTEPNAMTYFRAWTLKEGRVSATSADCAMTSLPTYPYAPGIEFYPTGSAIKGWSVQEGASDECYVPWIRAAEGDNAVRALSTNGARQTLFTPELPLGVPLRVTFEFAIETMRAAEASEDSGSVELPKGDKPGEFGDGSLDLKFGDTIFKSVDSYSGTMKLFGSDEYVTGSSTFETFTADLPAIGGTGRLEISFAADSKNSTTLYMRGFTIESLAEAPAAPAALNAGFDEMANAIDITATRSADAVSTMILVSDAPFDGEIEDGRIYRAGEHIGNAVVAYNGDDSEITVRHQLETTPQELTVTAYSHTYGLYSPECRTLTLATTGIDSVATDSEIGKTDIYNVAGVRLHVSSLSELPAGIYIVAGKKIVVN